jgi:DEAD/DEAH box helicase domain-containing protein
MVAQVQSPHAQCPVVYLWEAVPGGVGLSARLFDRTDELIDGALELVSECACDVGCPACVGPRGESRLQGRALSIRLLRILAGHDARAARSPRGGVAA